MPRFIASHTTWNYNVICHSLACKILRWKCPALAVKSWGTYYIGRADSGRRKLVKAQRKLLLRWAGEIDGGSLVIPHRGKWRAERLRWNHILSEYFELISFRSVENWWRSTKWIYVKKCNALNVKELLTQCWISSASDCYMCGWRHLFFFF